MMDQDHVQGEQTECSKLCYVNPLTPMSDQDKISPYNINTISRIEEMRI